MKDLRIQRTYILLKNAFFQLLAKKPFEEISVSEICDLAMVHRTTFYHHFQDKYDLLDFCIKDIKQELIEEINKMPYKNTKEFYFNLISTLLDFISSKKDFISNIIKYNSKSSISEAFMSTCVEYIYDELKRETKNGINHIADIRAMSYFYSGAVISTIIWWLKDGKEISEEEIKNMIINLIFKNA